LQNIISGGTLNNENTQKAKAMLIKKCNVFQNGALKRGKMNDVQHYQKIINQFSEI